MDKIKNMRAFQDGRRLVIVIEDADDAMLSLVRAMLSGTIPAVQHMAPPPPMEPPKTEAQDMKEILPVSVGTAPKFIQKNTGQILHDSKGKIAEQPQKENISNDSTESKTDFDVEHASYFEIKDFLLSQRENVHLKEILFARTKSWDLDFVLNVKGEKELKEIARQLMGGR